jgi:Uncharacterized protein conserved in bacteria
MTSLNRLMGLPVVFRGEKIGQIERAIVDEAGKSLRGIVVRSGIRPAKWLSVAEITALGGVSVVCGKKPCRLPKDADFSLSRVKDTSGLRLGVVTDVLLDERSYAVCGLEISSGPVDDFMHGRKLATEFVVKKSRLNQRRGDVLIPCGKLTSQSKREE